MLFIIFQKLWMIDINLGNGETGTRLMGNVVIKWSFMVVDKYLKTVRKVGKNKITRVYDRGVSFLGVGKRGNSG